MPPDGYSSRDAIYFGDVEEFGEWPILLSAKAQKHLQDVQNADGVMFKVVMKKIEQLSKGQFSRSNRKLLTTPQMGMPIYGARMTGDRRIIYQISCISDPRNSYNDGSLHECQAIWIFGIFTLAELHHTRFWRTLSRQFQQRGPEYVERCTVEQTTTDDDVILPALFPPLPELDPDTEETSEFVSEEDIKEIHALHILDKFVMMSKAVLNSILVNQEVVYVPPLSTREREIVEHSTSCYVIGRSGTGKTTTMLLKMLGIQRAWKRDPSVGPKPRQVFVTQSHVLATKVEEYFEKLVSSLEADVNPGNGMRMAGRDNRRGTGRPERNDGLVGQQYISRWRSDLPKRFSELVDEHFPLFITYDQLCTLLENDIGLGFRGNVSSITSQEQVPASSRNNAQLAESQVTSRSDYMQQFRKNFVSYGVFLTWYWDRLPETTTRRLDPASVFGEFMGVIKGSESAIGKRDRCLDRETYNSLSSRTQATFANKRDVIYDLFEAYNRLKRRRGDYDAADRTHRILEAFRSGGLVGRKMNFLYVDEVQDHLLIDTLVLRTICTNQHGLFWAGDTAQTISLGSSFRFADLKAYQYRVERRLSGELGIAPVDPKTFELTTNHRSHSGIVNCARSIVKLIISYWPNSIDALKPEQSTTPGFRPIFFASQKDSDIENFFTSSQGEAIGLGAEQCMLLRNDATKEKLQERFPQFRDNFMTLHESKGLEFNDVILYNFFEDSTTAFNQWRLVLNEVPHEDRLQDAPTFDETRHASICVELKFLYVAITRARQNLWIVDNSEKAEPMKMYWISKDQITIWSSNAEMPRLAVKSTVDEWLTKATTMFNHGRYEQASGAFRRAGREREAKICDAYLLQEKAEFISTTADTARTRAFVTAATAFSSCARNSPPDYVNERRTCYQAAGDCYSNAHDTKNAGDSYRLAELYTEAACAYHEGEHFEDMVKIIIKHKKDLDDGLYTQLITDARLHYFKRMNIKAALKLFSTGDEALEFLDDWDLDEVRVKLLVELNRVLEAAAIHAENGDMLKAVETLSTSTARGADFVQRMTEYLLTALRPSFILGMTTTPSPTNSAVPRLLMLADQLDQATVPEKEFDELVMFKTIQSADNAALRTLAKTYIETKNDSAALLCLDHVFSSPLKLQNLPLSEVQASLSLYYDYIRLLEKFRRDKSFASDSNHQRLFGFKVLEENRWLVPKPSLLHGKLINKSGLARQSVGGYKCGFDELHKGITGILETRIKDRTIVQNKACCTVHGFLPCLRLLVQGKCDLSNTQGPCTFQHVNSEQLSVNWYHATLRLILLQFQILEFAHLYDFNVANYWLRVLYLTLHPPSQRLESLAKLTTASMPENATGLWVVRNWAQRVCNQLNDSSLERVDRYRQIFVATCTLAFDLGKNDAQQFVPRTTMYKSKLWPVSPFRGTGKLIVQDFVSFLSAKARDSLTLGTSYLRGVLYNQLPIDLNVLCDLFERLTGLFIMAHKVFFRRHVPLLHGVVLPRSWFIDLILPDTDLGKPASSLIKFTSTMVEFMQEIDAQLQRYPTATSTTKERFLADGRRVSNWIGPLYISRICLCLCIIGYNLGDSNTGKRILASIQSLRRRGQQPTPLPYQRYAHAKGWDDLMYASTESLPSPDEMILLLHKNIPGPRGGWPEHVFPVVYDTLDGVPKLLLSKAPGPLGTIFTPVQQQQRVEIITQAQLDGDHDGQPQPIPIDAPQEGVTDIKEAEADRLDSRHEEFNETQVKAAKVIQAAYSRHLERKRVAAALKIQAACRRYLRRKNIARKGIDESRVQYWKPLRERSEEMEWEDSRYYLLFRVPLADVLICLDLIWAFLKAEKKDANKRMGAQKKKDGEELMDVIGKYISLLKQTTELRKKLSPNSEFHERGSVADLQDAVLEVKTIVESIDTLPGSIKAKNRINKRWDRGWKWILEKQSKRGSKTKA